MATNHTELLDKIGGMTVLELSEFVEAFKEKFNVQAMAAQMAAPGMGGGAAVEAAPEQEEFRGTSVYPSRRQAAGQVEKSICKCERLLESAHRNEGLAQGRVI